MALRSSVSLLGSQHYLWGIMSGKSIHTKNLSQGLEGAFE